MMRKKKSRKSERNYMKLDEEKKIESSKRHLPSKILFPVPLKPLHSYEISASSPRSLVYVNEELSSLFIMKPSIS